MKWNQIAGTLAVILTAVWGYADTFGSGANEFSIDFVSIGNASNAPDATGYGTVNYDYRIGTHEITIDQFARARAADSRIDALYYDTYSAAGAGAPATLSFYQAAKFCNWLTSGNALTGAYLFNDSGTFLVADIRYLAEVTYDRYYVVPTENEWYKAAYYKPVNDGTYSLYASGLNTTPIRGTTNGWNYYNGGYAVGPPNIMWETGYGGLEQNGTYDMMGNAWEMLESAFDGTLDTPSSENRTQRGGGAYHDFTTLHSSYRYHIAPQHPGYALRVVAIGAAPVGVELGRVFIDMSDSETANIRFQCTSGATCRVQYATNLMAGDWMNLGDALIASGSTNSVADSILEPTRYYRVIAE